MTVSEALKSVNTYPISDLFIEKVCTDRELNLTDTYTKSIGGSQAYELATADVWFYLSKHPSIVEQEVGINNAISIKQDMLDKANQIYAKYDDPGFTGFTFGMIGENWNG